MTKATRLTLSQTQWMGSNGIPQGHRSGMSLLEFLPPVRRELANVKTHLSDQDGMTLPWCLQKPWMMVTQDDIQVVRRSWDLNGSHSKAGAIRPSQRAVEYGGTLREGALGVKAQGSGDQRTGLGVHLRAGWLLLVGQPPPGLPLFPFLGNSCSCQRQHLEVPQLAVPTPTSLEPACLAGIRIF